MGRRARHELTEHFTDQSLFCRLRSQPETLRLLTDRNRHSPSENRAAFAPTAPAHETYADMLAWALENSVDCAGHSGLTDAEERELLDALDRG